jgi:hypothetical protein
MRPLASCITRRRACLVALLIASILLPQAVAAQPVVRFDFVAEAANANWTGQAPGEAPLALPPPGVSQDFRTGFVWLWDGATPAAQALGMHPRLAENGAIFGDYAPELTLQEGDVFRARIGFLADDSAEPSLCLWQLGYLDASGYTIISSWRKARDGQLAPVEVGLSEFANRPLRLVLRVYRAKGTRDVEPVWLAPRIEPRGL